jgi:hypothetical protein
MAETTAFTRTCAWTGEEFEGKGYILTTTEGTEVVSAAAFLAPWTPAPEPAAGQQLADGSSDVPPDPDLTKEPA